MNQQLPGFFRSLRALQTVNTVSVSAALSAATTVALGALSHTSHEMGLTFFICGITTFLACVLWMRLLRQRATVGKSSVRIGWLLSIPIAAGNAAVSAGILLGASSSIGGFFGGLFYGATFGVIIWAPALVATLALFGIPIAVAQRRADQGLSGEENGERIVGASALVISLAALGIALMRHAPPISYDDATNWFDPLAPLGYAALLVTAAIGAMGGLFSVFSATMRERSRRDFVREAEAGNVKGYRVEPTPQGKVLLRVSTDEADYRVGDIGEEELFALDEQGQARQAIEAPRR